MFLRMGMGAIRWRELKRAKAPYPSVPNEDAKCGFDSRRHHNATVQTT